MFVTEKFARGGRSFTVTACVVEELRPAASTAATVMAKEPFCRKECERTELVVSVSFPSSKSKINKVTALLSVEPEALAIIEPDSLITRGVTAKEGVGSVSSKMLFIDPGDIIMSHPISWILKLLH